MNIFGTYWTKTEIIVSLITMILAAIGGALIGDTSYLELL